MRRERGVAQLGSGQPFSGVFFHGAEAFGLLLPVLAGPHDVVVAAADEVPPHSTGLPFLPRPRHGKLLQGVRAPESRWPRCSHAYKIRYRNAAGRQAEESGFSTQEKAKARLADVYQARKSNPQNQYKAERM